MRVVASQEQWCNPIYGPQYENIKIQRYDEVVLMPYLNVKRQRSCNVII